ncbi:MAG TPA: DUF5719 family protein [Actinomycetota bacterium]|jgi:hypothetical protein|nr:DUF5719 family protein [Actinomycetota bacterium]
MRSRGQIVLTAAIVAVVAFTGVFLDRSVGVRDRSSAPEPSTSSGAWLCPHGAGPKDWAVTLEVANPGEATATVRVTSLGADRPGKPKAYEVPPGTTLAIPAKAREREASSYVEYFGSWVAVGWVAHAEGSVGAENGVAAEPCAPGATGTWFAPEGTSVEGEDAYLIVVNPFDAPAILDVVMYTKGGPPARIGEWSGFTLAPHRSVAFLLSERVVNEEALSAEVDVSRGRVAVASLGVSAAAGGIRSAIGLAGAPPLRTYLPVAGPGGRSTLTVVVPGTGPATFDATLLSDGVPQPAGALTDQRQGAQSAEIAEVLSDGASAIDVVASGEGVVVARRSAGLVNDSGSTAGVPGPASGWVVLPTAACDPNTPGLALVNPGEQQAEVTLHILPRAGESPATDVTVSVPPARTVAAPEDFLAQDPHAAVLVTSTPGTVIASGASSSCGQVGISAFAVAVGIPLPT